MNCQVFLDGWIMLKIVFFVDIGLYFESFSCNGLHFFLHLSLLPANRLEIAGLKFYFFIHLCTKYSFENSDCQ